jgi:hypothetical protein
MDQSALSANFLVGEPVLWFDHALGGLPLHRQRVRQLRNRLFTIDLLNRRQFARHAIER